MVTKYELDFIIYCIDILSEFYNLNRRDVYNTIDSCGLISSYIVPNYEILHTQGKQWLIEDLTNVLQELGVHLC